jgi:RimJ/RimL family protein N-acetyltransferase
MSLRNRDHLRRYESGNVAMSLESEEHARTTLGEMEACWNEGVCYFVGVLDKLRDEFVAQLYVGPFATEPVDYIIGYMADCAHEGQGYVTEAVTAIVASIFDNLEADQVRIQCDESNARSRAVAERCGFLLDRVFPEEKQGADGHSAMCSTTSYLRLRRDSV